MTNQPSPSTESSREPVKVGVIGLGMMGQTHLDIYAAMPGVRVVAVADRNDDKRSGATKASGNIDGQAQGGFDLTQPNITKYRDALDLVADPEVQAVDICIQTPGHVPIGLAALSAGKHTLIEKPLARTHEQARELVNAAEDAHAANGTIAMPAMCMRFWPGWDWLKDAIDDQRFGPLRSLTLRRLASHPDGRFYSDGKACGGAILDLHVHDADFVLWCLGRPQAVSSVGCDGPTGCIDHVVTQYRYGNDGPMVVAEGGWTMSPGFGFSMQYTANFERATARFDLNRDNPLEVVEQGSQWKPIKLNASLGYARQIEYFINCIHENRQPSVVTLTEAAEAIRLVEAENRSVASGQTQSFN